MLRWVATAALLSCGPACTAQRLVAPWVGAPPMEPRFEIPHVRLHLAELEVTNRGPGDGPEHVASLACALVTEIRRAARYRDVGGATPCDPTPLSCGPDSVRGWRPLNARGGLWEDGLGMGNEIDRGFENAGTSPCASDSCSGLERAPASEVVEVVEVRARLVPREEISRTVILDAPFFFYPFAGFWPLTPAWGRVHVELGIDLSYGAGAAERFRLNVSAPFSMIFYSWYRTEPIEEAYRRAYGALFREAARRMAVRIRDHVQGRAVAESAATLLAMSSTAAASSTATSTFAPAFVRGLETGGASPAKRSSRSSDQELLREAMRALEGREMRLPEEGLRIVVEPVNRSPPSGGLARYLGSLGGLEVSRTGGEANVRSRAATEFHGTETVGTGQAVTRGYRVSFYRPPDRTSLFFPPRLGFFSQDIEIRGFRQALPVFEERGATEISAVVSDPGSGLPVDIGEAIAYFLRLKSGYIGQSVGLNLVLGVEEVQLFSTVLVGVNVFEVRHTDVTIAGSREKGLSVAAFGSGQGAAQIGIEVPDWHVAVRTAAEIEWFRAFRYPKPLEFRASVAFHPEKRVFERERAFVEGAALVTLNWQVAILWLF